jgi:hypothetical protein
MDGLWRLPVHGNSSDSYNEFAATEGPPALRHN